MKKILVLVCLFTLGAGLCFAADPAEGFWISVDEKTGKPTAGWEIYTQGGKLFGRILSIYGKPQTEKAYKCKDSYRGYPTAGKVSEMTVVGNIWMWGLALDQAGQWSGGNIIDPDTGNMYGAKVTFRRADGSRYKVDTLEMRGSIGPIGRSQFWTKASKDEAAGLR
jgi:uncharacterized protein (DUF2147 family)